MPGDDLTIGIDIGSSALKAVAVSASGHVVATLRRKHRLGVQGTDRMEHDARTAWRRAPMQTLERLLVEVNDSEYDGEVRAICVAGMVPSMTAVDTRGIPRTPGLLYGDVRGAAATPSASGVAAAAAAANASTNGSAGVQSSNGSAAGSKTEAGKSVGPTGHAPDLLRYCVSLRPGAIGYWPAQAVLNFALSGAAVVDTSTAIAMAPLYDGQQWSDEQISSSGANTRQLPSVVPIGAPVGRWRGMTVASGIVDTLAEQLVAGAVNDGDVLVICGTTLVVWCVTSTWREVPGLWTVPHTVSGKVLIGGASNAGGLFLDWARSITASLGPWDRVGEHVPVWAPYPRGERTPLHDPERRAMLVDLQLSDGAPAIRRAAAEATGFVVRRHVELAGVQPKRIIATGGGSKDKEWMAALADSTGLPVELVRVAEGAALGAAWVARMAAGYESSLSEAGRWAGRIRRIEPGPGAAEASDRYKIFLELSGSGFAGRF